jgi:hypothetical protein
MTLSLLLSLLLMPGVALAEKGGAVAGTLRSPDGSPAAGIRVGVMAVPEPGRGVKGAGTLISQAETDDAGKFQFEEVPPGRYYIVAGKLEAPTFYPGVGDMSTAKLIQVVAKATVRDIDFVMSGEPAGSTPSLPMVKVTGRVVVKNNPKAPVPPSITLQTFPVAANFGLAPAVAAAANLPLSVPRTTVTLPVAPDGTFKADLFAVNQHLYVVGLTSGYSVVSLTSGGTNLLTQPIDVKTGTELIVSLAAGDIRPLYRLVALVREDSSDRPLAGERVELVHASGEVVRLTVNAQGMVTFPSLLQGTYTLRLVSSNFDTPEKQVIITNSSVEVGLRARNKNQ